jgi:hypothetical protein
MKLSPLVSRPLAAGLLACVALGGAPRVSHAAAPELGVPSALVITKSSNKNEVHYAVQVDAACAPVGPRPVSPYWLMRERGPGVTEPLRDSEERVLGIQRQDVTSGSIDVSLRGFPGRTLTIHTWKGSEGRCDSSVDALVGGAPARVLGVFVKQRLFGISYVLLTGVTADGAVVRERFTP